MTDRSQQGGRTSHEERFPVLGVTTAFSTNATEVRDAIRAAYGSWSGLPDHVVTDSSTLVRVLLDEDMGLGPGGSSPTYKIPDPRRLLVLTEGAVGVADASRNESIAYVSPGLVSRPRDLVDEVLEPLTLFLLGVQDRAPLHAAAVVRDGVAVLLAGPSGAGKSTLAYAARRSGFTTLADEPVYVQTHPTLRVWGRRSRLHLPIESRDHFPELRASDPVALPNGKNKIVVAVAEAGPRYADRMGICLLRRGDVSRPGLEPLSPAEVVAELTGRLDPGFDLFADSIGERVGRIAELGAWALTWSGGPEHALPLLDEVTAALSGG